MGIKAFANGAGAPDPNTITNLLTPGTELTEAEAKLTSVERHATRPRPWEPLQFSKAGTGYLLWDVLLQ